MSDLESWEKRYKLMTCPLRRMKPRGPLKGCGETCQVFKACVALTLNERDVEERAEKIQEYMRKELERLDRFDA